MITHILAGATITTTATTTPRAGYSTGCPGRIAAGLYVTHGDLTTRSGFSGRIITADSSSSALAAIGLVTRIGVTTGTDTIPTGGMATILRGT